MLYDILFTLDRSGCFCKVAWGNREAEELYRELFEKYYPGQGQLIEGFWMPNPQWEGCRVDDPSARVLSNYGASGE